MSSSKVLLLKHAYASLPACAYIKVLKVLARWRWVIADGDASTEKAQTLTQTTCVHTHTTEYPDNGLNTTEKERLVHVFSYPTVKTHFLWHESCSLMPHSCPRARHPIGAWWQEKVGKTESSLEEDWNMSKKNENTKTLILRGSGPVVLVTLNSLKQVKWRYLWFANVKVQT